jgi:hypothetical protein
MLSNQIKRQDITSPPWFCFPQQLLSPWSKKTGSRYVQRVNSHERCWYHSWQDHDPSLMLSNQIKWQDIVSPHWFCFLQWLWRPWSKKTESCFVQRVNTHEGYWYHSWQDHNPGSMLSNQIKWQDITSSPHNSASHNNYEALKKKSESCFVQRVDTHKVCWYHSWQDHNPSSMLRKKTQMTRHHLPLILFLTVIMKALN